MVSVICSARDSLVYRHDENDRAAMVFFVSADIVALDKISMIQ